MARTLTTLVVVGLAALVAVACATAGRDFDRTNVNNIKPQVHDKAQIKAWFGEPMRVTTTTGGASSCKEMWIYQYGRSTQGGKKTSAAALAVVFDENGKVCESAYSEQKN